LGSHEDMANARLTFANGCVATLSASRVSPVARRHMRVWGAEGYAGIDFAKRSITLVQPGKELRQGQINVEALDARGLERVKNELFSRYLQSLTLDCNQGDQLTRELADFVNCVRTGTKPRVGGQEARD